MTKNAQVEGLLHDNVMGEKSHYIKITGEQGSVLIKSGESTMKKLIEIGLSVGYANTLRGEIKIETENKKGGNEMVNKK